MPNEKTKQLAQCVALCQIKGEAGPLRLHCAEFEH